MLVSIVIPTYKRFDHLKKSLQSAKGQTYPSLQIVVTDDGSNDPEQDAYVRNQNVEYVTSERNHGFVHNLNRGLSRARGEYISILFDDDFFLPDYIQRAMEMFRKHGDVAFVQMGCWNEFDTHTTSYWPPACGKIPKYLYLAYVLEGAWSISPCNYVFENRGIKFRETLYEGFHERQLKRGSGYDALFIMDHLKHREYCYHDPAHECVFSSHGQSITMQDYDTVVADTKKGVRLFFEEEGCYAQCELYKHCYKNLCFRLYKLEEYVSLFRDLIETHDLSMYELKHLLYHHDRYNLELDAMKRCFRFEPTTSKNYAELEKAFAKKRPPTYSMLKYMSDRKAAEFDASAYHAYLWKEKFMLNEDPGDLTEEEMVASDAYRKRWAVTFSNVLNYYWEDFTRRNLRKIALVFASDHLRYLSLWKIEPRGETPPSRFTDAWNQVYVHVMCKRYTESHENTSDLKNVLVSSDEFRRVQQVRDVDPRYFEIMRRVWEAYALPISYRHALALAENPGTSLRDLSYDAPHYDRHRIAHFYQLNEIIGEDLHVAAQISGHERSADVLARSLAHLKRYARVDTFIHLWTDSKGERGKVLRKEYVDRQRIEALFRPKDMECEDNDRHISSRTTFSGTITVEIPECIYPHVKSQLYGIYRANKMREKYDYDLCMKLRFDSEIDKSFCTEALFHMYFTCNYKNFVYASSDEDHKHPDGTGCNLCNLAYWEYGLTVKHDGAHANDICDFMFVASPTAMSRYSNLYHDLEEVYDARNERLGELIHLYDRRQKITHHSNNVRLPDHLHNVHTHYGFRLNESREYKIMTSLPFYPEAILKSYLQEYMVVSNRYFRVLFRK
jgi:glycosyltransferase involved in cell wall biosynthesis